MSRVFSAIRFVTILILLVVLLFTYASFPEKVGLYSNQDGDPAGLISRNTFFYITLLLIVLINGVFIALINLVKKGKRNALRYKEAKVVWLHGMISLINAFFIVSLVFYTLLCICPNTNFSH